MSKLHVDRFLVPAGQPLPGSTGRILARGEGWHATELTLSDGRPAVVLDESLLVDLIPGLDDEPSRTIYVFSREADRSAFSGRRGWTAG